MIITPEVAECILHKKYYTSSFKRLAETIEWTVCRTVGIYRERRVIFFALFEPVCVLVIEVCML